MGRGGAAANRCGRRVATDGPPDGATEAPCAIPTNAAPSAGGLRCLRELLLQRARLLEALRNVAHDRCQPGEFARSVAQRHDRELDGDPGAVLFDPGNREDVAMTVTALATPDDVVVAVPMALAQPLRDDDVQGLSDGGIPRIAENALRSRFQKRIMPSLSAAMIASELVERTALARISELLMTGSLRSRSRQGGCQALRGPDHRRRSFSAAVLCKAI